MLDVRQTASFMVWLAGLRNRAARKVIGQRLARVELGLLGDIKPVGAGVTEMRIDVGPGYRLYYCRRGASFVILLCGGDKSSQRRDIARAQAMAAELE